MRGHKVTGIPLAQVEKLAGFGCTIEDIAGFFDVGERTIKRRLADTETTYEYKGQAVTFAEVFERGKAKGRVSIRRFQFAAAEAGDRTMLVWLGKQLLGQRDQVDSVVTSTVNLRDDRTDAKSAIEARLARIIAESGATEIPSKPN